jgi:hypothetical protein
MNSQLAVQPRVGVISQHFLMNQYVFGAIAPSPNRPSLLPEDARSLGGAGPRRADREARGADPRRHRGRGPRLSARARAAHGAPHPGRETRGARRLRASFEPGAARALQRGARRVPQRSSTSVGLFEPEQQIIFGGPRGEHDDRDVRLGPQDPAHVQTVDAWHHHVEYEQVGRPTPSFVQRRPPVRNDDDGMAFPLQIAADQVGLLMVVLGNEDPCSHVLKCSRIQSRFHEERGPDRSFIGSS